MSTHALDHEDQRLVVMANQIAAFFARQRSTRGAAAETAEHLVQFWTPAMRQRFKALAPHDLATEDGERLCDIARHAAGLLEV
jgi:hypothetical protein